MADRMMGFILCTFAIASGSGSTAGRRQGCAMAASEAQKRAIARYIKRNVKRVQVAFYPAERVILEWVGAQPNMAGYVKRLIREDMKRRGGKP